MVVFGLENLGLSGEASHPVRIRLYVKKHLMEAKCGCCPRHLRDRRPMPYFVCQECSVMRSEPERTVIASEVAPL